MRAPPRKPGRRRGTIQPQLRDGHPGRSRPLFNADPQPIRNGDLANVSANLLGLNAVPGSLWCQDLSLTWHN